MKSIANLEKSLVDHVSSVSPGKSFTLSNQHQEGEGVWQGDLGISISSNKIPFSYVKVSDPLDSDRQVVPESGQGSHHRISSLENVEIYLPPNWGKGESLDGPFVKFLAKNSIVHEPNHNKPHGTVFIESPMCIQFSYQRNLSSEEKIIRARD